MLQRQGMEDSCREFPNFCEAQEAKWKKIFPTEANLLHPPEAQTNLGQGLHQATYDMACLIVDEPSKVAISNKPLKDATLEQIASGYFNTLGAAIKGNLYFDNVLTHNTIPKCKWICEKLGTSEEGGWARLLSEKVSYPPYEPFIRDSTLVHAGDSCTDIGPQGASKRPFSDKLEVWMKPDPANTRGWNQWLPKTPPMPYKGLDDIHIAGATTADVHDQIAEHLVSILSPGKPGGHSDITHDLQVVTAFNELVNPQGEAWPIGSDAHNECLRHAQKLATLCSHLPDVVLHVQGPSWDIPGFLTSARPLVEAIANCGHPVFTNEKYWIRLDRVQKTGKKRADGTKRKWAGIHFTGSWNNEQTLCHGLIMAQRFKFTRNWLVMAVEKAVQSILDNTVPGLLPQSTVFDANASSTIQDAFDSQARATSAICAATKGNLEEDDDDLSEEENRLAKMCKRFGLTSTIQVGDHFVSGKDLLTYEAPDPHLLPTSEMLSIGTYAGPIRQIEVVTVNEEKNHVAIFLCIGKPDACLTQRRACEEIWVVANSNNGPCIKQTTEAQPSSAWALPTRKVFLQNDQEECYSRLNQADDADKQNLLDLVGATFVKAKSGFCKEDIYGQAEAILQSCQGNLRYALDAMNSGIASPLKAPVKAHFTELNKVQAEDMAEFLSAIQRTFDKPTDVEDTAVHNRAEKLLRMNNGHLHAVMIKLNTNAMAAMMQEVTQWEDEGSTLTSSASSSSKMPSIIIQDDEPTSAGQPVASAGKPVAAPFLQNIAWTRPKGNDQVMPMVGDVVIGCAKPPHTHRFWTHCVSSQGTGVSQLLVPPEELTNTPRGSPLTKHRENRNGIACKVDMKKPFTILEIREVDTMGSIWWAARVKLDEYPADVWVNLMKHNYRTWGNKSEWEVWTKLLERRLAPGQIIGDLLLERPGKPVAAFAAVAKIQTGQWMNLQDGGAGNVHDNHQENWVSRAAAQITRHDEKIRDADGSILWQDFWAALKSRLKKRCPPNQNEFEEWVEYCTSRPRFQVQRSANGSITKIRAIQGHSGKATTCDEWFEVTAEHTQFVYHKTDPQNAEGISRTGLRAAGDKRPQGAPNNDRTDVYHSIVQVNPSTRRAANAWDRNFDKVKLLPYLYETHGNKVIVRTHVPTAISLGVKFKQLQTLCVLSGDIPVAAIEDIIHLKGGIFWKNPQPPSAGKPVAPPRTIAGKPANPRWEPKTTTSKVTVAQDFDTAKEKDTLPPTPIRDTKGNLIVSGEIEVIHITTPVTRICEWCANLYDKELAYCPNCSKGNPESVTDTEHHGICNVLVENYIELVTPTSQLEIRQTTRGAKTELSRDKERLKKYMKAARKAGFTSFEAFWEADHDWFYTPTLDPICRTHEFALQVDEYDAMRSRGEIQPTAIPRAVIAQRTPQYVIKQKAGAMSKTSIRTEEHPQYQAMLAEIAIAKTKGAGKPAASSSGPSASAAPAAPALVVNEGKPSSKGKPKGMKRPAAAEPWVRNAYGRGKGKSDSDTTRHTYVAGEEFDYNQTRDYRPEAKGVRKGSKGYNRGYQTPTTQDWSHTDGPYWQRRQGW